MLSVYKLSKKKKKAARLQYSVLKQILIVDEKFLLDNIVKCKRF